jgi:hypothetical protein
MDCTRVVGGDHLGRLVERAVARASEGVLAVLLRFGVLADCENAALSSSHVGDAVPARAVEARALSGP